MNLNDTLSIVTTGRGIYLSGLRGRIVGGSEREVFLGSECERHLIPEFDIVLDSAPKGVPRPCQYGRDFVFSNSDLAPALLAEADAREKERAARAAKKRRKEFPLAC